jgi:trehalose 6-phosphate synthase
MGPVRPSEAHGIPSGLPDASPHPARRPPSIAEGVPGGALKDFLDKSLRRIADASNRAAARVGRLDEFAHIPTRENLLEVVGKKLKDRRLILVSNREPYAHILRDGAVACIRSAGGLTTALDSIARAFHADWVCHGDAEADFEVTDAAHTVAVPPGEGSYRLRRLRLTPEEEKGYYDGFSNETLWPLCHVCYVRPRFQPEDWEAYEAVNRRFAQVLTDAAEPGSVVFLQDYHLARVAHHVKAVRTDLTLVLFWHIPWPNPEIFRILPWKKELLEGLLANDILGFHLGYHAGNFLESVAAEMECHIDWERNRVTRGERTTRVNAYPISIDFQALFRQAEDPASLRTGREIVEAFGLKDLKVLLGVDRLDYTKGIPERLEALDRLLLGHPEWVGKVRMVQVGVPSRTRLEDYQQVVDRIDELCTALNAKWRRGDWVPVLFLKGQLDYDALVPFYRLADVCVVSSLHDGMNLVAKEFVAASSNDKGVLVLSKFTGAARELEQALPVNPYDAEAFAETLHQALAMPAEEQKARLERMRVAVAENNIYTWAGDILEDVIRLAEDSAVGR